MIISWIKRFKALNKVDLQSEKSNFLFSKKTQLIFDKTSNISVNGTVTIGYAHPKAPRFPSNDTTVITVGKNSKLIFEGNVYIANGTSLFIGDNATCIFKGNNYIARNATILCHKEIIWGKNTSSSWNFLAIDDDLHTFHNPDGTAKPKTQKSLIIGDNVAIQANVTIPRGVEIGNGSIVGACSVVRQNIPENVLFYNDLKPVIKEGYTYGFQFQEQQ